MLPQCILNLCAAPALAPLHTTSPYLYGFVTAPNAILLLTTKDAEVSALVGQLCLRHTRSGWKRGRESPSLLQGGQQPNRSLGMASGGQQPHVPTRAQPGG